VPGRMAGATVASRSGVAMTDGERYSTLGDVWWALGWLAMTGSVAAALAVKEGHTFSALLMAYLAGFWTVVAMWHWTEVKRARRSRSTTP